MEIGEGVGIDALLDLTADCPFDHELEEPPKVKNNIVGIGGNLATNMNNGKSTKLYKPLAPENEGEKVKWGKLPQKDPKHDFFKGNANKGRCLTVNFNDGTSKKYPVSCSAHHLIPSQESLKNHKILEYMCKKGTNEEHNHGYSKGVVWSDVGYETNGSENGVYLPGSYAVGGGKGGLKVWYPIGDDDDEEHDTDYIEVDKLPEDEYKKFLISGKDKEISTDNACWHYVAQAMRLTPGQFHDRHLDYSKQVVQEALKKIYLRYKQNDVTSKAGRCSECEKKIKKIKQNGLPAPYTLVNRLENLSFQLRRYLTAGEGSWKLNIFTSKWCEEYMLAVRKKGKSKKAAEYFEKD